MKRFRAAMSLQAIRIPRLKRNRSRVEWLIVVPVLILAGLSILTLFSIKWSPTSAQLDFNPYTQLGFVVAGIMGMGLLSRFDYRLLKNKAFWIYLGGVLLLGILFFEGEVAGGAQRWLDIAGIRFQPGELAKAALIVLLARLFSSRIKINSRRALVVSTLYTAPMIALFALQPDLSSAIICALVWLTILSATDINKRLILVCSLAAISVALLSVPLLADYQRERLLTFVQPTHDPSGIGYNSQQALITVGSGGMWGQGLSGGSQSQLLFLPEQHTDFIFAVLAEKLGFAGVALLMLAAGCLVVRLILLAGTINDRFGSLLLVGVSCLLGVQFIVNIGMNIGLLPVTGLPLPFVSYGGTHTLVSYGLLGLSLAIARQDRQLSYTKHRTQRSTLQGRKILL